MKTIPERAEDLSALTAQVEAIRRDANALTAGLTDNQFNWQPDPSRWSIAHCLQHLVVSADGLVPLQETAIERGRARGLLSDGPYRHGWLGTMIAGSIEPPIKRRFKTARALVPTGRHTVAALLGAFQQRQNRLEEVITRSRGLDLGKVRVPFPGLPIVRLSLGQSIAFTLGHERRHLWQAREVRDDARFPAS